MVEPIAKEEACKGRREMTEGAVEIVAYFEILEGGRDRWDRMIKGVPNSEILES